MFEEANCDHRPLRMILNRDHGCFGMKRAVGAFDQDAIAKFQRTVDHKQNLTRRAVLDDSILKRSLLAFLGAIAISGTIREAELDGDPDRRGLGKEPGQPADDVWFESMSNCLVWHGRPRPGNLSSRVPSLSGWKELRGRLAVPYRH